jgi:hypothetical protein
MTRIHTPATACALAVVLGGLAALAALAPRPAPAQSCSDCPVQPQPPEPPTPPWGPGPVTLTTANTDDIAAALSGVEATCLIVDPVYRIDCLRAAYAALARSIPDTGDYRPVRAALLGAVAGLDAVVTANADPATPDIRPRQGGKPLAPRLQPVRAVAPGRLAAATEAARKVVADTGILILRSGDTPPRRTVHYQRIAAAVDGNLILLRSG